MAACGQVVLLQVPQCHAHAMLDVETAEGNKVSKSFYYVGTKF